MPLRRGRGPRIDDMTRQIEQFSPLSTPVFHILLALGQDLLHGYAIMQAIEAKTGGRARVLPGTLYSTMNRMLDDGLIEESRDPPPDADRRRRYYGVTELGRQMVAAEAERMAVLLAVARRENLAGDIGEAQEG